MEIYFYHIRPNKRIVQLSVHFKKLLFDSLKFLRYGRTGRWDNLWKLLIYADAIDAQLSRLVAF